MTSDSGISARHPDYYFEDGNLIILVSVSIKFVSMPRTHLFMTKTGRVHIIQCAQVNFYKTFTSIFGCLCSA